MTVKYSLMLTSNCGFDAANDQFAVKVMKELRRSLLTFFKPALLARVKIVQYHYLTTDVMQRIVKAKLAKLKREVIAERYKATVTIAENILKHIEQQCGKLIQMVRLVHAILEEPTLPPLSLALLLRIARGEKMSNITINFEEGEYQVDIA